MAAENDKDDWRDVRFRPRREGGHTASEDSAHARFIYGAILFLVVAAVYPWYSYWVQSRLLTADANRAAESLQRELRAVEAQADSALQQAADAGATFPRRPPSPRILGISEGASGSVIVADLDGASLAEAESRLCSDAARWSRRATQGRTFRIQRYRGSAPAINVGTIRC